MRSKRGRPTRTARQKTLNHESKTDACILIAYFFWYFFIYLFIYFALSVIKFHYSVACRQMSVVNWFSQAIMRQLLFLLRARPCSLCFRGAVSSISCFQNCRQLLMASPLKMLCADGNAASVSKINNLFQVRAQWLM